MKNHKIPWKNIKLKQGERQALSILVQALAETLKDNLVRVIIYGSKARGDQRPDSDTDLMVIIKKISKEQRNIIYDNLLDIELEYDTRISLAIYTEEEYQVNQRMKSFFIENVQKEGIELWVSQG